MAEIEFGTFVEPEKVNPFAETVAKLAEAPEGTSVTLTSDVKEAAADQFKFQRAANAIGKTARLRIKDESGVKVVGKDAEKNDVLGGVVKLTFTLTAKHKQRRGQTVVEDAPAAE